MLDLIDCGEGRTIFGDGSVAFDLVAVEDCARSELCLMAFDGTGRVYNFATGKRTSPKEVGENPLTQPGSKQPHALCTTQPGRLCTQPHRSPICAEKEIDLRWG
jgi:UDP-glucose 4-epimerase